MEKKEERIHVGFEADKSVLKKFEKVCKDWGRTKSYMLREGMKEIIKKHGKKGV